MTGGSARYVEKLVATYRDRILLCTPVTGVRRQDGRILVDSPRGDAEAFDAIFFACHSDQALAILGDPTAEEQAILGAIQYQPNEAILHTDERLLPDRRRALAAWNYRIPAGGDTGEVLVTYSMNTLQNIEPHHHYCVSLNSSQHIRGEHVIQRINYEHPIFNTAALDAQERLAEINGYANTYFCGAYWGWGFHEDGVRSAHTALESFEANENVQQRDLRRAG